jgi:hypothetical protein
MLGDIRRDASIPELTQELVMAGVAETLDSCDNADVVSALGKGLHQEAIRLVPTAVGGVVEGIVGKQNAH